MFCRTGPALHDQNNVSYSNSGYYNTNNREIKPRDDLYLLKDNKIPSVLIECGFLSNEKEAKLLTNEEYQEKIAWAIYVGIQNYFTAK